MVDIGDIEDFCRYKSPIFLKDADIGKVLVTNKISSGEKYYKWMYFFTEDKNIILFGIKSALISKKNFIASLSINNNF